MIVNKIIFPKQQGIKCNMMPFIQGNASSLPDQYKSYSKIINKNFLEKNEVGFLTIDESFVNVGSSQRGYNSNNINRNVHIEVGRVNNQNRWGNGGSNGWGGKETTLLDNNTKVLIANNISNTCRYWNTLETSYTLDGDLSDYINKYPENTGILLKKGEMLKMSIFTPHECIVQKNQTTGNFLEL